MPRTVPALPGTARNTVPTDGGIAPAARESSGARPTCVRLQAAHFAGHTMPSHGCLPRFHQLAGPAQIAETRQMTRRDDPNAETACLAKFRQARSGLDAVHVQDIRPLVGQPPEQVRDPRHRDAMVGLVLRWMVRDRIPEDRHAVILVLLRQRRSWIGRGDQHLVPGLLQPPAQPLHVHLGPADAVGKIPADQVRDLHGRAAVFSLTRV